MLRFRKSPHFIDFPGTVKPRGNPVRGFAFAPRPELAVFPPPSYTPWRRKP